MSRIALFPGSFDPITVGHVDIVLRSAHLFDKLVIGVGNNSAKQYMFPLQDRIDWIRRTFSGDPRIEVISYTGLTVECCKEIGARFILRGLRAAPDFEYERSIAQMNRYMDQLIETVFMLSSPQFAPVSSTVVRDIIRHGGDVSTFVPEAVSSGL
ncbi:MAG: pantetheine-phosphate adenylyltransferase [Bacteroidota bacterium]|jgi:pantetheine-phosphate adenylyltransferase